VLRSCVRLSSCPLTRPRFILCRRSRGPGPPTRGYRATPMTHPSIFEEDRQGVAESSTSRPRRPRPSDLRNLDTTTVASELSMRARNGIERLLGPKCKEWTPSQLAARLAELSGLDVIRTPNIGRFTLQEIEAYLERHGHRFADGRTVLDRYPRDEMRIRKYALRCALVVRRRRGGAVLAWWSARQNPP
jgi:hypothetical protein